MITAEEFITVWQKSNSFDEVCKEFPEMGRRSVSSRAASYRKKKIKLKKFPPGGCTGGQKPLDIARLQALAESLQSEHK